MAPIFIIQSMTDDGYCPDWWYSSDIEDMDNFVEWNMATFCNLGLTNDSNQGLFCKKYCSLFTIEHSQTLCDLPREQWNMVT